MASRVLWLSSVLDLVLPLLFTVQFSSVTQSCPTLYLWYYLSGCCTYIYGWDYPVMGFPSSSAGKESACNGEDLDLILGLGRSPGEGNGYPLQYSCLENFMDRGAWKSIVHGVAKDQTWVRDIHFTYPVIFLNLFLLVFVNRL